MVGAHYRVGKKIGEGSFGVVFEGVLSLASCIAWGNPFYAHSTVPLPLCAHSGINILTNTPVAIKFVRFQLPPIHTEIR